MENEKVEQATLVLLKELKQEIEKGIAQEINFSRVYELLAIVHEPVRFLASKEIKIKVSPDLTACDSVKGLYT